MELTITRIKLIARRHPILPVNPWQRYEQLDHRVSGYFYHRGVPGEDDFFVI